MCTPSEGDCGWARLSLSCYCVPVTLGAPCWQPCSASGENRGLSDFFFHVYFLFFKFFSVKCPGSSITYKHDFYGGVERKVTGGRALLCCPREDRDITSCLSSLSLSSCFCRSAQY